ncbi:MAG: hypothetical protein AAF481_01395 [Acidobacteriota bacterium]
MSTRLSVLLLAFALALAGCTLAPTPDDLFEQGDLSAAVTAYESTLADLPAGAERNRALFRLALIYDMPSGPAHDPARSRQLLEQLAAQPETPYGRQAQQMLSDRQRIQRLRRSLTERRERISRLHGELTDLMVELAEYENRLGEKLEENQRLDQTVEQLEANLATLRNRLTEHREAADRLSLELERLKEIDLASPP